ncbi:MAG: hypothetical protein ACXADD_19645 [Candidatus Thorarchaeota archaeon]|jgi:hypothetical protein
MENSEPTDPEGHARKPRTREEYLKELSKLAEKHFKKMEADIEKAMNEMSLDEKRDLAEKMFRLAEGEAGIQDITDALDCNDIENWFTTVWQLIHDIDEANLERRLQIVKGFYTFRVHCTGQSIPKTLDEMTAEEKEDLAELIISCGRGGSTFEDLGNILIWDDYLGGWSETLEMFIHDVCTSKSVRRIQLMKGFFNLDIDDYVDRLHLPPDLFWDESSSPHLMILKNLRDGESKFFVDELVKTVTTFEWGPTAMLSPGLVAKNYPVLVFDKALDLLSPLRPDITLPIAKQAYDYMARWTIEGANDWFKCWTAHEIVKSEGRDGIGFLLDKLWIDGPSHDYIDRDIIDAVASLGPEVASVVIQFAETSSRLTMRACLDILDRIGETAPDWLEETRDVEMNMV